MRSIKILSTKLGRGRQLKYEDTRNQSPDTTIGKSELAHFNPGIGFLEGYFRIQKSMAWEARSKLGRSLSGAKSSREGSVQVDDRRRKGSGARLKHCSLKKVLFLRVI